MLKFNFDSNVSLLSQATVSWLDRVVFKAASGHKLTDGDVSALLFDNSFSFNTKGSQKEGKVNLPEDEGVADYPSKRLSKSWEEQWRVSKSSANFFFALLSTHSPLLLRSAMAFAAYIALNLSIPVLVEQVMSYLDNTPPPRHSEGSVLPLLKLLMPSFLRSASGYGCVFLLGTVSLLNTTVLSLAFTLLCRVAASVRDATTDLLYLKSLRLAEVSNSLNTMEKATASDGTVLTLISTDVDRLFQCFLVLHWLWAAPVVICISLWQLLAFIGTPGLAGVMVMGLTMALQLRLSKQMRVCRAKAVAKTEERLKFVSETLGGIKSVKISGLEDVMAHRIEEVRRKELKAMNHLLSLKAINMAILFISPTLMAAATFLAHVALKGEQSFSETAIFSTVAYLNAIRAPLVVLPQSLTALMDGLVSCARIEKFLGRQEIEPRSTPVSIGLYSQHPEASLPSLIREGGLTMIVGATGGGKSELLRKLKHYYLSCLSSTTPLSSPVAFVGSTSWLMNGSIQENIVFFRPFEPEAYSAAISASCLVYDLQQLSDKDNHSVGDNGSLLSGGQRVRVDLARAFYGHNHTSHFFCEDPLRGLDERVATQVFDSGFLELLQGKTRVMTLNGHYSLLRFADQIVVVEKGSVLAVGSPTEIAKVCPQYFVQSEHTPMPGGSETSKVPRVEAERERAHSCEICSSAPRALFRTHKRTSSLSELDSELGLLSPCVEEEIAVEVKSTAWSRARLAPSPLSGAPSILCSSSIGTLAPAGCTSGGLLASTTTGALQVSSPNEASPASSPTDDCSESKFTPRSGVRRRKRELVKTRSFGSLESVPQDALPTLESAKDQSLFKILKNYLEIAGRRSRMLFALSILAFAVSQGLKGVGDWYTSQWDSSSKGKNSHHFGLYYVLLMVSTSWLALMRSQCFVMSSTRAAEMLHQRLLNRVLKTPLLLLLQNPSLINALVSTLSRDIDQIDGSLPDFLLQSLQGGFVVAGVIVVCVLTSLRAALFVPPAVAVFFFLESHFRSSFRDIRDLENSSRVPVVANLRETLCGLPIIRAYKAEKWFLQRFRRASDRNSRHFLLYWMASRWLSYRLDIISALVVAAVAFAAVFEANRQHSLASLEAKEGEVPSSRAGIAGLALTYALQLTGLLQWMTRSLSLAENSLRSAGVALHFVHHLPQEGEGGGARNIRGSEKKRNKEPSWPRSIWAERKKGFGRGGRQPSMLAIRIEDLSSAKATGTKREEEQEDAFSGLIEFRAVNVRYQEGHRLALRQVSFRLCHGQKLGVCGRTGSGKSTLVLSLLRMLKPETGSILIGGVDLSCLSMKAQRAKMVVIPQDPFIFSTTLRDNIDPHRRCTDERLWQILSDVGLKGDEELAMGLDGTNGALLTSLSIGKRQLISIARAMVQKPAIVILDEVTSGLDPATERRVHVLLGKVFASCTMISIAHRLNTIVDSDLIAVLENGRVVEFQSPSELLQNPESAFASLMKNSTVK